MSSKVISKTQIVEEMMCFKSSFEKVLYNKDYRLYWNGEEELPTFTATDAKQYLYTFLKVYKEHHYDFLSCGIIKINKNSIFVDKYFEMHSFINEMLSLFDNAKCFANAIHKDNEFITSPFI
ncbi:hypothetical protein CNO14_04820 (plasmid) [Borrelia miyamotoi]|uniref:Uncharacterized protein n=2 Tax=Borrelia miyamotoi TaxID=47466 RepID=A0AAQ3HE15_9SPIR|nr:hypothetical protein [Borrelia miyamotoi]ATQ15316.1 hypothetical protein CNO14_04820 [Borrelia miyamotoi]ATQ16499.1 hypothetical protein CNO13_04830 [Borrelia miyamotoi]ATQ17646.1 hypothetical protein CNO12_04830 [Borrelia miyamotoi]ATQ18903.1 hypothetical protein CNO11_04870 [Borrelia miyamotoi]ATQ21415.1 hypothetical protein CNO09_04865 [Borrelia miyamotoi]